MSNFYEDFLHDKEQLSVLEKALKGSIKIITDQLKYVDNLGTVNKIPVFKIIPIYEIDMTSAMYDVRDILNKDLSIIGIGITPNMSISQRYDVWNALTIRDKVNALEYLGIYVVLTNEENFLSEDSIRLDSRTTIESLEIYDSIGQELIHNIDYALDNNKLYLLQELSLREMHVKKKCMLKNVMIDAMAPEDILGDSIGIPYDSNFTSSDYAEILKSFTKASLSGAMLKDLKAALSEYTTLSGVEVFDFKSAPETKKSLWEGLAGLSRFDFVVSIPPKIISNSEKLKYVQLFFNKIKPAYTNYIFVPEQKIKDILYVNKMEHLLVMGGYARISDKLNIKYEKTSIANFLNLNEYVNIISGTNGIYSVKLDNNVMHDRLSLSDYMKHIGVKSTADKLLLQLEASKLEVYSSFYESINGSDKMIKSYASMNINERVKNLYTTEVNNDDVWATDDNLYLDENAYLIDRGIRVRRIKKGAADDNSDYVYSDKLSFSSSGIVNNLNLKACDNIKSNDTNNNLALSLHIKDEAKIKDTSVRVSVIGVDSQNNSYLDKLPTKPSKLDSSLSKDLQDNIKANDLNYNLKTRILFGDKVKLKDKGLSFKIGYDNLDNYTDKLSEKREEILSNLNSSLSSYLDDTNDKYNVITSLQVYEKVENLSSATINNDDIWIADELILDKLSLIDHGVDTYYNIGASRKTYDSSDLINPKSNTDKVTALDNKYRRTITLNLSEKINMNDTVNITEFN